MKNVLNLCRIFWTDWPEQNVQRPPVLFCQKQRRAGPQLLCAMIATLAVLLQAGRAVADNSGNGDQPDRFQLDVVMFQYIDVPAQRQRSTSVRDHKLFSGALSPAHMQAIAKSERGCISTAAPILLTPDQSMLASQVTRLKRRSELKVLWTVSIQAPLDGSSATLPVLINVAPSVGLNHRIEGVIHFSRKRFLHVSTDLWVNTLNPVHPLNEVLAGRSLVNRERRSHHDMWIFSRRSERYAGRYKHSKWTTATPYYTGSLHVEHTKKLRPEVLHYMDHPLIGMLVMVTPVAERPQE